MLLTPSERTAMKIQGSQSTPERQPFSAAEARTAPSKIKEMKASFDEAFQEAVKMGDLARVRALDSELEFRMASLRAWLLTSEAFRLSSPKLRASVRSEPPTISACPVVAQLCAETGAWLRRQSSVEESLTDWLLYQLTERTAWIKYRKFTRYDESTLTGADREWCLVGDRRCLMMRVQAKKILGHNDLYPHLAYANRRGLQIEHLIENARQRNMLPFYVLYHVAPAVRCSASRQVDSGSMAGGYSPTRIPYRACSAAPAPKPRLSLHSLTRYTATFFKTTPSELARHCRTLCQAFTSEFLPMSRHCFNRPRASNPSG